MSKVLVDQLAHELSTLDLDTGRALEIAVPTLGRLLELELACAYNMGPRPSGPGYDVDFFLESGPSIRARFIHRVNTTTGRVAFYDPAHPESAQRNRVLVHPWEVLEPLMGSTLEPSGVRGVFQIRAILCEGPSLLAWVGGFRRERPSASDLATFQRLVPPLRRRLVLERRLGEAELWESGLVASLEALSVPSFVVAKTGAVRHANNLGATWLDEAPSAVKGAIQAALAGDATEFQATPIGSRGAPPHVLLIARGGGRAQLDARLAAARIEWQLTDRQIEVLSRLALGDATKDIALRLSMSPRTVEQHVRELTRKAGAEGRLHLVARLWGATPPRG